jgi:hypothetical protein
MLMTADAVSTLGLTLAAVKAGPLADALLPNLPDAPPGVALAARLADLPIACAVRVVVTLLLLRRGAACARGAGLGAAAAAHVLIAAGLAAKAVACLRLTGGDVLGGELPAGCATVAVLPLLAAELLGILFSG